MEPGTFPRSIGFGQGGRTHEQQVPDVSASDHDDEPDGREQHDEHRPNAADSAFVKREQRCIAIVVRRELERRTHLWEETAKF